MKNINDIAKKIKERINKGEKPFKLDSKRHRYLMEQFVTEINKERMGSKWRKVSYGQIGKKLQHLTEDEKDWFLSICKDYKHRKGSFGKCFWGALKVRDNQNKPNKSQKRK